MHFDRPLNKRQERLLHELPEYDSKVTVKKDEVKLSDIAALTAKTGVEFALFTRKGERMVVRGNEYMTNVTTEIAREMANSGWKWSGHTHPSSGINSRMPSDGDYAVLKSFEQNRSVILDSTGKHYLFGDDE